MVLDRVWGRFVQGLGKVSGKVWAGFREGFY